MDDFMLTVLASNARYNYWNNRANGPVGLEAHDEVRKHAEIFCRNYGGWYFNILKAMLAVDEEICHG